MEMVKTLSHPSQIAKWEGDLRKCPEVSYSAIFNYFVLSLGVDGCHST